MVHHLQNIGGLHYECLQAREKLAYQSQDEWLKQFGQDLQGVFEVDKLTILVRSSCGFRRIREQIIFKGIHWSAVDVGWQEAFIPTSRRMINPWSSGTSPSPQFGSNDRRRVMGEFASMQCTRLVLFRQSQCSAR
jgi:hypothetical protein